MKLLLIKMDAFLKKVDQVATVDTSKLNMFLLKEKALEFTKLLSENPNFTQGKICKILGTSDSTMRRIRNDLGMSSPFRHTVRRTKTQCHRSKKPEDPISEGNSYYCTKCSKVFKSRKSSENHVCKKGKGADLGPKVGFPKDTLASGGFSIFNTKSKESNSDSTRSAKDLRGSRSAVPYGVSHRMTSYGVSHKGVDAEESNAEESNAEESNAEAEGHSESNTQFTNTERSKNQLSQILKSSGM